MANACFKNIRWDSNNIEHAIELSYTWSLREKSLEEKFASFILYCIVAVQVKEEDVDVLFVSMEEYYTLDLRSCSAENHW